MQQRSRTEYSILNILTGVGGYIINTILGFVCRMVFVRYLSADYLGVNGLFSNILTMLSLAELGVGGAIVYALYKPLAEHDEEKIASLMKIYAKAYRIIGLVVALVGLALMPFLTVIVRQPPNITENLYLLYGIYLFNTASTYWFSYRSSLIIAAQQNYIVTGVNYLVTILQSVVQMLYLVIAQNYLGYLIIQTIGTLVYNVAISQIAVRMFPCIKSKNVLPLPQEERQSLLRNIRDLMAYKISGLLVNSTDNILITFFKGLATTGVASNYTLLVNTLNSLLSQVFNGLTASIGNHNVVESEEHRYQLFRFLNMANFWIFGWATLGIVFVSGDLVCLCFGEEYVLDWSIPLVLALNFYTVGMQNAVWTYKHTLGLFRYGRFLQLLTATLNIIFSVLLGYRFGVAGILLATFFSRALTNLWYDPYVVFRHGFGKKIGAYARQYLFYLVILLLAGGISAFLCRFVTGSVFVRILWEALICSTVFHSLCLLLFHKKEEFRYAEQLFQRVLGLVRHKGNS